MFMKRNMTAKSRAGQAGAEHDWVRLIEKLEDVPDSLNVSDEMRKATLAELSCLVRLEDIKMRLMNEMREPCAPVRANDRVLCGAVHPAAGPRFVVSSAQFAVYRAFFSIVTSKPARHHGITLEL